MTEELKKIRQEFEDNQFNASWMADHVTDECWNWILKKLKEEYQRGLDDTVNWCKEMTDPKFLKKICEPEYQRGREECGDYPEQTIKHNREGL